MKPVVKTLLWLLIPLILAVAAAGALVALMEHQASQRPAFPLQTLSGETVRLDELAQGGPMAVNLWATWCPPCIREMPLLQQAEKNYPGVTFVFANQGEHAQTVSRFLQNSELELKHVILDSKGQLAQVTASMALPTTLFFDAEGRQTGVYRGELKPDQLAEQLDKISR